MQALTAIKKILDRILIYICIICCACMVLLVSYQVASRFILGDPSAISEDAARIFFVWMGLFASALLYGEKGHMNISYVPEKLGPVVGQLLSILSEICTFAMAMWVLTYGGYIVTMNAMGQVNSAMTWLRVGVIYSVIPISGCFVLYYAIYNILSSIQKIAQAKNGAQADKE